MQSQNGPGFNTPGNIYRGSPLILSSSTSNLKGEFGGITGGNPRAPYPCNLSGQYTNDSKTTSYIVGSNLNDILRK